MVRRLLLAAVLGACASTSIACGGGRPAKDASDAALGPEILSAPNASITLRGSLVADQYFWLRTKLLDGDAPPEFREALEAMRALRDDLGGDASAWEDLELVLGNARRAEDLTSTYGELPKLTYQGANVVMLRQDALRLARAMAASEGAFRAGPYREHRAAVERAAADLGRRLGPNEATILTALDKDLGLGGSGPKPVITLVYDAPYPGAFAADESGRTHASFVRVRGLEGTMLAEVVLHEVIGAVDELTVRTPTTALNELRQAFARRGTDAGDPNVEMAVNTVAFAEAGSLIRRFVDPAHVSSAESGFFTLYPPAKPIVLVWDRHVAGGASVQATADAIAQAVAGGAAQE